MLVSTEDRRAELVLELAEEFLERYRKGERPPLREYVDKHPDLESEIREVFPAMAIMENIALADDSLVNGQSAGRKSPPPLVSRAIPASLLRLNAISG